jgi:hypothetical protein
MIRVILVSVSKSAEQKLRKDDKTERLPVGNFTQSKYVRHQPIPQEFDRDPENEREHDGKSDPEKNPADYVSGFGTMERPKSAWSMK